MHECKIVLPRESLAAPALYAAVDRISRTRANVPNFPGLCELEDADVRGIRPSASSVEISSARNRISVAMKLWHTWRATHRKKGSSDESGTDK